MVDKTNRTWFEEVLRKDGINIALIDKMTYEELLEACLIEDYDDYNQYMNHLASKYDI